jgi:hypothetical protein
MCYKNIKINDMSARRSTKIGIIAFNRLVLGSHKEDKHKHNHVLRQPGPLNLLHKREAAWEEGQEEPYELGVEQADVEE